MQHLEGLESSQTGSIRGFSSVSPSNRSPGIVVLTPLRVLRARELSRNGLPLLIKRTIFILSFFLYFFLSSAILASLHSSLCRKSVMAHSFLTCRGFAFSRVDFTFLRHILRTDIRDRSPRLQCNAYVALVGTNTRRYYL